MPFLDGRVLVMSAASAGRGDASDRILLRSKVRHLLPTSHHLGSGFRRRNPVVPIAVEAYFVHVCLGPRLDPDHQLVQGKAQFGELVGDRDRHARGHCPGEQPVTFEGAQRLGEHLLADPGEAPGELE